MAFALELYMDKHGRVYVHRKHAAYRASEIGPFHSTWRVLHRMHSWVVCATIYGSPGHFIPYRDMQKREVELPVMETN